MEEKICSSCDHKNVASNYFCTQCGSKFRGITEENSRLCIVNGEPSGAVFLLKRGRNPIGRDGGNVIVLSDQQISNKHATVLYEEGGFWIEDRQSKNGVYLDGQRIGRALLKDGSVIRLGSTVLRFDSEGEL